MWQHVEALHRSGASSGPAYEAVRAQSDLRIRYKKRGYENVDERPYIDLDVEDVEDVKDPE